MNTPTLIDVVSLGKACSILQAHPQRIREAAEELGVEATVRINHVDHFDVAALERIREHLNNLPRASL